MNIVILGPPGSGKGTQAELLIKKKKLIHIDIGLSLRQVAEEKSPLGRKIDRIINKKKELVPDSVIKKVVEKKIAEIPHDRGIIIDGAPRRIDQLDEVEKGLKKFGRRLTKVIYVKISVSEAIRRISKRYQCHQCEARLVMGKDIKSPKNRCPKCGGNIERRADDTPAGLKKRFAVFRKETLPVIEYYRQKGILIEVDGKRDQKEVFGEILKKL